MVEAEKRGIRFDSGRGVINAPQSGWRQMVEEKYRLNEMLIKVIVLEVPYGVSLCDLFFIL